MKWLFLLLVLANLAFWGFSRLDVPPPPVDWKTREINAGKLALVPVAPPKPPVAAADTGAPAVPADAAKVELVVQAAAVNAKPTETAAAKNEAPSDPKGDAKPASKAADAPKPELVCFAWHGILAADLPNVRKKVAALQLGGETHLQAQEGDAKVRYWVFIAPRGTNADAQKKADELKGLGVTDYFVVNDGGKWQNAISLGLFANRDSAERRLAAIKDQGVRSAQMQERSEGNVGSTLMLKKVPKSAKQALEAAAQSFRGSTVSESDC
jgi:hypothetical protein